MRIGFIFECPPSGPDQLVIEHLAERIGQSTGAPVEIVNRATNTNKAALMQACGTQARLLLGQGCERVVIVWDLKPRWASKEKPYCLNDVSQIRTSLRKANVDEERVRLLCITAELEALLVADERALKKLLDRDAHKADCPYRKNPHRLPDPKGDLEGLYKAHGRVYSPLSDALKIVQAMPDLNRLTPIPSFKRLAKLLTDPDFVCRRTSSASD